MAFRNHIREDARTWRNQNEQSTMKINQGAHLQRAESGWRVSEV